MTEHRQPFRLDGLAASFAAAVDADLKLFQRGFDLGEMLLRAFQQRQVQLPLIDQGVANAQAIVALRFEASAQHFYFAEHFGALSQQPGACFSDAVILDCHLEPAWCESGRILAVAPTDIRLERSARHAIRCNRDEFWRHLFGLFSNRFLRDRGRSGLRRGGGLRRGVLLAIAGRPFGPLGLGDLAQAQPDAAAFRLDAQDAQQQKVAGRNQALRMIRPDVGHLGNMQQALDASAQPGKCAEIADPCDHRLDQLTDFVVFLRGDPWIRLYALQAQADALTLLVNAQYLHIHLLPTRTTSLGCVTGNQASSEMWIRPSAPPMSTNTPKLDRLRMMPVRTSPGWIS